MEDNTSIANDKSTQPNNSPTSSVPLRSDGIIEEEKEEDQSKAESEPKTSFQPVDDLSILNPDSTKSGSLEVVPTKLECEGCDLSVLDQVYQYLTSKLKYKRVSAPLGTSNYFEAWSLPNRNSYGPHDQYDCLVHKQRHVR
jgi:hypothetical protein